MIKTKYIFCFAIQAASLLTSFQSIAHDAKYHTKNDTSNPRGITELDFKVKHVNRVVTAGYPVSFGVYAFSRREPVEYLSISNNERKSHSSPKDENLTCLKSNFVAFDIDDDYAFDINETITIDLLIDRSKTSSLVYGYDKHGSEKANGEINLVDKTSNKAQGSKEIRINSSDLVWKTVTLEQARFANRGISGTDFVLTTNETMQAESRLAKNAKTTLVVCDMKISRNNTINIRKESKLKNTFKVPTLFTFYDNQQLTPVRIGLYDSKGSAVLFDNTGVTLPFFEDQSQHQSLPAFYPPYQYWPINNRYFSYADGKFNQSLAPGTYTLIATKGPEYRIVKQQFTINDKEKSKNIEIKLTRWQNFPEKGWYSGDVHIHIERTKADNENLIKVFQAEDLHFSNLLEMSTSHVDHYPQYDFGEAGQFKYKNFQIIPGVEGPRTAYRGHAIALNIKEKYSSPDSFFLYHKYFASYQKQQALIGYAHVGSGEFNASLGLALDMPFQLIDFVEVMQSQRLRTELWYEFLNLGFKLAPAAGSDYPYFEQPGAVRSYVNIGQKPVNSINKNLKTNQWFEQLRLGKTFVSNLPLMEMTINNQPIGSILKLNKKAPLNIAAKIYTNGDYDHIANVELIQCGEVIKELTFDETNNEVISFNEIINQPKSGWIALRVKGADYALGHTGAFYIEDQQGSSACSDKAPAIIDKMIKRLDSLETLPLNIYKELEYWEAGELELGLMKQKSDLIKRINMAKEYYQTFKSQF